VIIKVERSGGVAGIRITSEMDARQLPPALATKVRKIMENSKLSELPLKVIPKGAADHYSYKISFAEGENQSIIECNQYNIKDELKSLIRYIERNAKKK
jgi:hypothetical protein